MDRPLVSVIIPNYNYANYVGSAVDSVLGQTYPNIEIIVIDDGSTDGSREILEGYGDRINAVFQTNQGVSAARNNGVTVSRGELIAFLDADDYWLSEKIEKQVQNFAADPSLGLVHVAVDEIDTEGTSLRKHTEGLDGFVSDELVMLTHRSIFGGGSGLMVPRTVFDEAGGFDTRLSTSADWDLFYQISSKFKVGFVPEVLLKYRFHHSNMHANVKEMEHDMTIAYEKAFARPTNTNKSRAYANLYKILAGSYFRAGKYGSFVRTAVKSIGYEPANLLYFAKFPLRRMSAE